MCSGNSLHQHKMGTWGCPLIRVCSLIRSNTVYISCTKTTRKFERYSLRRKAVESGCEPATAASAVFFVRDPCPRGRCPVCTPPPLVGAVHRTWLNGRDRSGVRPRDWMRRSRSANNRVRARWFARRRTLVRLCIVQCLHLGVVIDTIFSRRTSLWRSVLLST